MNNGAKETNCSVIFNSVVELSQAKTVSHKNKKVLKFESSER